MASVSLHSPREVLVPCAFVLNVDVDAHEFLSSFCVFRIVPNIV